MSFIVTGAGHSGTKFLATQLAKAEGWKVLHEPDQKISFRKVQERFDREGKYYGEVNSYLLTSFLEIKVDHRVALLRNPYSICMSVARSGCGQYAVDYVREAISLLDIAITKGALPIRFTEIITDPSCISSLADYLGIDLPEKLIDVSTVINKHDGESIEVTLDSTTQNQFNEFIERYKL